MLFVCRAYCGEREWRGAPTHTHTCTHTTHYTQTPYLERGHRHVPRQPQQQRRARVVPRDLPDQRPELWPPRGRQVLRVDKVPAEVGHRHRRYPRPRRRRARDRHDVRHDEVGAGRAEPGGLGLQELVAVGDGGRVVLLEGPSGVDGEGVELLRPAVQDRPPQREPRGRHLLQEHPRRRAGDDGDRVAAGDEVLADLDGAGRVAEAVAGAVVGDAQRLERQRRQALPRGRRGRGRGRGCGRGGGRGRVASSVGQQRRPRHCVRRCVGLSGALRRRRRRCCRRRRLRHQHLPLPAVPLSYSCVFDSRSQVQI